MGKLNNYSSYDALPCSVAVFDNNGNVVYSNKFYEKLMRKREVKFSEDSKKALEEGKLSEVSFNISDEHGAVNGIRTFTARVSEDRVLAVFVDDSKYEDEYNTLKEKTLIDPLSKVYNRAAAVELIEEKLSTRQKNCECALIVLDIDNFKNINDKFGHLYGDAVITMVAGTIKSTLDEQDIMGRFGGDEFFVFINNAEKEALENKLENICRSVFKIRLDASEENDISCSIGVAIGNGGDCYEDLFRKADSALYKAKNYGKNRFEYFDGEYMAEESLSYAGVRDEHESNEEHNVVAMALEIASKSKSVENAIINILRHIGTSMGLDGIQVHKYDTLEDRVDLEFEWFRERNGEYNFTVAHKKTGYYAHGDLLNYKHAFTKNKIFKHTLEFEEGFSQKFRNVFKVMHDMNFLYSANIHNENVFHGMSLISMDLEKEWTEQELNDISEITKILSVYLNSANIETEREKMLTQKLDYDRTGLFTIQKFYDEAGRIGREANDNGDKLGVLHIDVEDLCTLNDVYGGSLGDSVIGKFAESLRNLDNTKAIACHLDGTDMFIMLFHTAIKSDDEIVFIIEQQLEGFCSQFAEYTSPPVILKAGLSLFNVGDVLGTHVDKAKLAKKHKKIDRCRCFVWKPKR